MDKKWVLVLQTGPFECPPDNVPRVKLAGSKELFLPSWNSAIFFPFIPYSTLCMPFYFIWIKKTLLRHFRVIWDWAIETNLPVAGWALRWPSAPSPWRSLCSRNHPSHRCGDLQLHYLSCWCQGKHFCALVKTKVWISLLVLPSFLQLWFLNALFFLLFWVDG